MLSNFFASQQKLYIHFSGIHSCIKMHNTPYKVHVQKVFVMFLSGQFLLIFMNYIRLDSTKKSSNTGLRSSVSWTWVIMIFHLYYVPFQYFDDKIHEAQEALMNVSLLELWSPPSFQVVLCWIINFTSIKNLLQRLTLDSKIGLKIEIRTWFYSSVVW